MLHVLYMIINISCLRKRIENPGMSCNLLRVVLGCVFNFMMCSKVIYTGLIKTGICNWNSDGYFHRACAICKKSWWKVPEKSGTS